jgi:hypothetical protein
MKGKLREDSAKYVSYYWITLLTTYLKMSKNCIFLSDSCPDQNRNHTVVIFLATLAANGRFNKIFQYFPVRGPCDRDFELIKKVLHEIDRVYTSK